jgi:hypothetical protein
MLGDMEHDRPRLEQYKIVLFKGRYLPERLKRSMRGFLHRADNYLPQRDPRAYCLAVALGHVHAYQTINNVSTISTTPKKT